MCTDRTLFTMKLPSLKHEGVMKMSFKVPIVDLRPEVESIYEELREAVLRVIRSGQYIMGENVQKFEREVSEYLGVKHAISLNSGTDALVIALRALGIREGDEVITTPFTFFATVEAISRIGAEPVFVDIERETFNINPDLIADKITERTRAILVVHLYGHPVDMDPVLEIAERYNLHVIEDCAQAFGAKYKGRYVGTLGNVGCFSFFPTKNLGGFGDGGMLVTDDDEVAKLARMLRNHGAEDKYRNLMLGYNSRLDEIQAAMLRVKLRKVEMWNSMRRQVAQVYNELLRDLQVVTPIEKPYAYHVYHQYTIRVSSELRDSVLKFMREKGIGVMIYYPLPIYSLPVYRDKYSGLAEELLEAERASREVLSLPIGSMLERDKQELVVEILREALENCKVTSNR